MYENVDETCESPLSILTLIFISIFDIAISKIEERFEPTATQNDTFFVVGLNRDVEYCMD